MKPLFAPGRFNARTLPYVLLGVASVIAGYTISVTLMAGRTDVEKAVPRAAPGRQLVLAYVGASTCGPSNHPDLPQWLATIRSELEARAVAEGMPLVHIGIAKEYSVRDGIRHLEDMGPFDEIAAGQAGLGQASLRLLSRDFAGSSATPQLILLEREIPSLPLGGADVAAVRERVILRRVGTKEIVDWARLGAPFPKPRHSAPVQPTDGAGI